MDLGENILLKLSVPTHDVTTLMLQEVLSSFKRERGKDTFRENVLKKLWEHIITKLPEFDDQLLCSTCFYTILQYSEDQDAYLLNVLDIINSAIKEVDKDIYVTLMYGLFQSSYLTQKNKECTQLMERILLATFKLLTREAYKYSKYTFIAFKTITSFKKVIDTNYQSCIFNRNNQIKLLNIINHNWENPLTAVRSLIRNIFHTLISILDKDIYNTILNEINLFYWNKAKFLMVTEIIEQSQSPISVLVNENRWLHGLMYSLHKPGLVSCGSDMYNAILKKTNSDNEWCNIFIKELCIIFKGSFKARENFYNYWCLITLKKFPSVIETLLFEILKEKSELSLLSAINVMKQGNKLALLTDSFTTKEIIEQCLVHNNPHIRNKAFDIICICHGKCLPDRSKYDAILEYLNDNINSDCTVLRINMIKSFSCFLIHLNSVFLINQNIEELKYFILNLQNQLKSSGNFNGNYQRKITTIKLIDVVFQHLNTVPLKSSKKKSQTLLEKLKNENVWILTGNDFILNLLSLLKDPADDIRQTVLHVLLNYYSNDIKSQLILKDMTEDVIKCAESKFFYDIDCGKVIFKLLISVLLKENLDARSVAEYFKHWYGELTNEMQLKRNIVDSIHDGKQLHSILGLLFVIFECCLQYKYNLDLSYRTMLELVDVLDTISNQFMCEESAVSYDFSRMNDLVKSLINQSNTRVKDNNETKISGLHQVVLNCLWLNVKVSCDLSALLITYVENEDISNRCLNIIVRVLETCRHKGAIEAAGSALGKSIQYLTSLPVATQPNLSQLPLNLLERKLKELILEAKMASVTRRGAGLSIMVHRIVSSDMKKGKPLFHYFMNVMLEKCLELEGANDYHQNDKDMPKAIHIHFLTRIVMDSSLASEMMFYSAKLAELAFNNLTSSHWQIRNAALQLYGALIPKLIGQKKVSGIDDETVSTVACDEFRTHSPKLWDFIVNQLDNTDDDLLSHTDLVPILNILASVARRYNFSYDSRDILNFKSLESLLGSQIYTVRRLASNCIINIFSFHDIYTFLMTYKKISENSLHGTMILLEGFLKVYESELSKEQICILKENFRCILGERFSYLSRTIFDRLFYNTHTNVCDVTREAEKNKYMPGVYLWANNRMRIFIENATWNDIANNIHILIEFDDFEEHSRHLSRKIDKYDNIPKEPLISIAYKMVISEKAQKCSGVWKFLYKLSKTHTITHFTNIESTGIIKLLSSSECLYKIRYLLPFAAKILSNRDDTIMISKIIFDFCDPIKESDMRYMAALANNEIADKFVNASDEVKINSIKSAIILLQDEDEDVRNISTIFYQNIKKQNNQAFICLRKILTKEFMDSVFDESKQNVKHIISELNSLIEKIIEKDKDNYNPFANDSKNIYFEDAIIKMMFHNIIKKYE